MNIINLTKITKKYEAKTGCFDVTIKINEDEIYGFIGPNGTGKTILIRQMIVLITSDNRNSTILKHDIWKNTKQIMENIGYLSGEVLLPNYMTGLNYLKLIANIQKNVA